MSKRPWMPLYIADYLKKTTHLSALESGAYLHLIMDYWQNGGLPDDDKQLARIAKMTDAQWRKAKSVLAAFFQFGWKHERVDKELAKAADITNKRRIAAEKRHSGGHAKAHANADAIAPARAPTLHTSHSTSEQAAESEHAAPRAIELRKGIVQAFERANSPNVPDTSRVDLWLSQGYDPDIVQATVTTRVMRKPTINDLKYFDNPIREAHECRAPKPPAPAAFNWDSAVAVYKATGNWPRSAPGSEPGMAGCKVPVEILRKYGYGAALTTAPAAQAKSDPCIPCAPLRRVGLERADDPYWGAIREQLVALFGTETVEKQFADARVVSIDGDKLIMATGSEATKQRWLQLFDKIGQAVRLAFPKVTHVDFVVGYSYGAQQKEKAA